MDVILLQDVVKLGAQGTIVQVKPGFARNYLLPRGLAEAASPARIKQMEEQSRQRTRQAQRAKDEALALKQSLEAHSLTLKLTVGEGDKPFGSISARDIVQALQEAGLTVEKTAVRLEEPIKILGVFDVPIRVHPEVEAIVKLWVVKA